MRWRRQRTAAMVESGDGRVLFLSFLSRLCSVMFRLNGEQKEGKAENEEREKK
jgi:hypothetical protein